MTKTQHYNLNKPEAGDPIRVADFNQNSDIIDAALKNLNTAVGTKAEQSAVNALTTAVAGKPSTAEVAAQITAAMDSYIIFGSFTGDGQSERFVDMECSPRLVILLSSRGGNYGMMLSFIAGSFAVYFHNDGNGYTSSRVETGGLHIKGGTNNTKDETTYYIAFM